MINIRSKKKILFYALFTTLFFIIILFYLLHNVGEYKNSSVSQAKGSTIHQPKVSAHSRVPEGRTPLRLTADKLLAATKQGDSVSAKELLDTSVECHNASEEIKLIQVSNKACETEDRPAFQRRCEQESTERQSRLSAANDRASICDGLSKADLDNLRYQAVTKAARLGDVDAQACFVESDFNLRGKNKLPLSSEEIEQYQTDAISYVQSGLERGDWRIVALMATPQQVIAHIQGFLGLVTTGDDMTIYRMTKLLRFGATGDYAAQLDKTLSEYTEARAKGLPGYPPEQLSAEDAWAQQQYDQKFANSPLLDSAPAACGN